MTKNDKDDLRRMRTLFALERIPQSLHSDLLSDGTIATQFNIKTNRPVKLGRDVSISQDALFEAFREAIRTNERVPLLNDLQILATAFFADDGAGLVEVGNERLRFDYAGLLSQEIEQRQRWLTKYLAKNSLTDLVVRELHSMVAGPTFSNDTFLTSVMHLQKSPQALEVRLAEQLDKQRLRPDSLLPDDLDYWDNLTAPLETSNSLADFCTTELRREFDMRMSRDPRLAIWSASLTFCAPGLVPIALLREYDGSVVLAAIEPVLTFSDHFALLGALEIAADWVQRDERFAGPGTRILDALFGEGDNLQNSCGLFATSFAIAGARLGLNHEWRKRPPFWRRLNMAAQASLFARAAGDCNVDAASLFSWAMEHFGPSYYASTCFDLFDEPRWRPDWIRANFLKSDAAGRARFAIRSVPEHLRPPAWHAHFTAIEEKLIKGGTYFLSTLPAVGESARTKQPVLTELGDVVQFYAKFIDEPTNENLMGLAPFLFTYGCPSEAVHAVHVLLAKMRGAQSAEDKDFQFIITVAVYVSVLYQDAELAEKAADLSLAAARVCEDVDAVRETIFRIIESIGADPDRKRSLDKMAKRLELLAFSLEPKMLYELHAILRFLQRLDDSLIARLARAGAAARLGARGVAA
ncbi:hypothetical protein [Bradyrhizobium sp.]|uniref:hypothetical protein n=1 Tax=Bradyrhizobium sp. TaxID=376 RepID=UPI0025B7C714|nr:hypothetical protein [Bradyrhizobium sp.]